MSTQRIPCLHEGHTKIEQLMHIMTILIKQQMLLLQSHGYVCILQTKQAQKQPLCLLHSGCKFTIRRRLLYAL